MLNYAGRFPKLQNIFYTMQPYAFLKYRKKQLLLLVSTIYLYLHSFFGILNIFHNPKYSNYDPPLINYYLSFKIYL